MSRTLLLSITRPGLAVARKDEGRCRLRAANIGSFEPFAEAAVDVEHTNKPIAAHIIDSHSKTPLRSHGEPSLVALRLPPCSSRRRGCST